MNLENARELFICYAKNIFANNAWGKKFLHEISENLDNMRKPITASKRKRGETPYYGASGVVDYVDGYIFNDDLLLVSEDGANLLMRTYPIAFSISGKSWINNHAHVLRFGDKYSQKFVEYYLNSIRLDDYVSGMAQPKLNQKMLNMIPIPYPDKLKVRQEIVEKLTSQEEAVFKLEETYSRKLYAMEVLRKSILQKAFTGELTSYSKSLVA